jgi:biopolymer transport protein ExbB/TolQ
VNKLIKITLLALLLLLVVFSILTDMPLGRAWPPAIRLGLYLKLASLLGLVIAAFVAWGYRNQIQASQKYRRADEAVTKANELLEHQQQACDLMEKRLIAQYEDKVRSVDEQVESVRKSYQKRLEDLQEQNLQLKETVGKLMNTIKKSGSAAETD